MSIFDVRHQVRAQRLLQQALRASRLPHAYMFYGPEGVGKEALAVKLARLLLCDRAVEMPAPPVSSCPELGGWTGPVRDACGQCSSCQLVDAGTHPDLHLIYRQLNRYHPDPTIRQRKAVHLLVDVIRHNVIDAAGLRASGARGKVFVIREAERMVESAQHAVLKTLEEPPPQTFLILVTSTLDRLLPTVRSRCQPVEFGLLPTEFIVERLSGDLGAAGDDGPASVAEIRLCATLAQGSLGAALRHRADGIGALHAQIGALLADLTPDGFRRAAKELVVISEKVGERYHDRDPEMSDTEANRCGLQVLLLLVAVWYRDVLHLLAGAGESVAAPAALPLLTRAAGRLTLARAAAGVRYVGEAEQQLEANANVQLCADGLMIRLGELQVVAGRA